MPQRPFAHVWWYSDQYFDGMCIERCGVSVPALKREVQRLRAELGQGDDRRHVQQRLADDYRRRYEQLKRSYSRLQGEYDMAVRDLREERSRYKPGWRR